MKTNLKKLLAGALAVSAVLSAQAFPANAATPGVAVVNLYNDGKPGSSNYPVMPAISSTNARQNAFISAVTDAAKYFEGLGFNYSNYITCYNSNISKTENIRTRNVLISTPNSGSPGNADTSNGLITFGPKASYMKDMYESGDTIAHEYAHLVTQQKLHWSVFSGGADGSVLDEANSIVEAYSDILGELSEKYPDWKMGSNLYNSKRYCLRDLSDPNSAVTPTSANTFSEVKYYTKADEFINDYKSGRLQLSRGDGSNTRVCYVGSTVLSHTAYLMYHYGISRDDLVNIWYKSLDYFQNVNMPSFADCRVAVTKAADSYLGKYDKATKLDKMRKISEAFDSAHIFTYVPLSNTVVTQNTLSQSSANNGTRFSNFLRSASYKYPQGTYWTADDVNTTSRYTATTRNGITIGPTFRRNFDSTYNYLYQEPYYRCAGFARKLQQEFYETTTFLHLTEEGDFTYVPRVGDHLRCGFTGHSITNDDGHSIFITGVTKINNNEYSIIYADCNANGDSMIAYTQSGKIRRSNGNISITLGNYSYRFDFVERPVMVGDVNGDSYVDSKDITLMQKLVNNSNYRESYSTDIKFRNEAADLNRNGRVDNSDLTALKNAVKSGVDFIGSYYYLK